MERKWNSSGTQEHDSSEIPSSTPYLETQIVGPEMIVATVMPLWKTGKCTPEPGKALVLRVGA
jgi:hypothetical protein